MKELSEKAAKTIAVVSLIVTGVIVQTLPGLLAALFIAGLAGAGVATLMATRRDLWIVGAFVFFAVMAVVRIADIVVLTQVQQPVVVTVEECNTPSVC
jgi:hypothetical protein